MKLGDWEFRTFHDGRFKLDGGAMFGVVPKALWEKRIPADARNRIPLAARALLLETPSREIRLGDRVEFIVPHCDPVVNLYDQIYAIRNDTVEAVWPIDGRGRSQ